MKLRTIKDGVTISGDRMPTGTNFEIDDATGEWLLSIDPAVVRLQEQPSPDAPSPQALRFMQPPNTIEELS